MTRARIESLLASFPKLIPTGTQHTSVETADVRYVYQPLEDLYILLITNKASNILQDIDTLHLFARVVSDMCRSADQREITRNAFALLSAFDEIVSLGYREQVNLMQVRNVLEMESHEEKIQEIIARVSVIEYFTCDPAIRFSVIFIVIIQSTPLEQRGGGKGRAQAQSQAARDDATRTATTRNICRRRWRIRKWRTRKLPRRRHHWVQPRPALRASGRVHIEDAFAQCIACYCYTQVQGYWYEAWKQENDTSSVARCPRWRGGRFGRHVCSRYTGSGGSGHA